MKTSTLTQRTLALVLAGVSSSSAYAQLRYDFKTTAVGSSSFVSQVHRSGFDQPGLPPVDDVLLPANNPLQVWIVADTGNNGLPFFPTGNPANSFEVKVSEFLGADDFVVAVDLTPGNAFGATSQPGRYGRNGVAVNSLTAESNVYFLVFDATGVTYDLTGQGLTPTANGPGESTPIQVTASSFGVFLFGNPTEPPVGNAFLSISSPVFADQFTVVPEPEEYAAMAGVGLLAFAGWYRRRQKQG